MTSSNRFSVLGEKPLGTFEGGYIYKHINTNLYFDILNVSDFAFNCNLSSRILVTSSRVQQNRKHQSVEDWPGLSIYQKD